MNTQTQSPATPQARPQSMWVRPGLLCLMVVAAVAYGSLIPFDFEFPGDAASSPAQVVLQAIGSPAWVEVDAGRSSLGIPYALTDLAFNLLLYLPVGLTLRMALRRRGLPGIVQIVAATLAGFILSWSVESMQGLIPGRVASINDVLMNTAGALAGACAGPMVWAIYKRLAFACYCRLVAVIDRVAGWSKRPAVAIVLAVINAGVIGLWYLGELYKADSLGRLGIASDSMVALPFERAFALPYDLGVLVLGEALLVYAGIGCLLMLLTYTGVRRLAMNWVVLGVVVLAFSAELCRALTHDKAPDVTGPMLALAAGALMTVTVYTFSFAIKRANRRHTDKPFDGPDRRRRPHEYA